MDVKNLLQTIQNTDKRSLAGKVALGAAILILIYILLVGLFGFINRHKMFASGTIEAIEIDVATKVPGRIEYFAANEGDIVNKGDLIASLEALELEAGFRQANAVETAARIRFENAKRNFIRAKSLKAKNMISDQEYDALTSNYEAAESEYNRAEAANTLAEISYNESRIKAPIKGTILTRVAEVGDLLAPYSTVVTMADLSRLEIMLYVPEKSYGRIKLGDKVNIMVDSFPRQKFMGKVINISNKAEFTPKNIQTKEERVAQVFGIKIEISNADMKLKPGMPADAVIYLTK